MRVYEVMSKDVETVKPAVHASEAKTRCVRKDPSPGGDAGHGLQGWSRSATLAGPSCQGAWRVDGRRLDDEPGRHRHDRTPIRRAAALMKGRSIGSLIVTSPNGKVAGIVTVADLLDLLARQPDTLESGAAQGAGGSRVGAGLALRGGTFASCGGTPDPRRRATAHRRDRTGAVALCVQRRSRDAAHRAGHLFGVRSVCRARPLGDGVSGGVLSRLEHLPGAAPRLLRHRPPQARLPECDREVQLPVLQLYQRIDWLRARDRRANRGLLVPDPPRPPGARALTNATHHSPPYGDPPAYRQRLAALRAAAKR